MSHDIKVYSVRPFEPTMFGGLAGWRIPDTQQCDFQTRQWQIVVNPSDQISIEDVDVRIASRLPGIGYLTELNLEGQRTNAAMLRLRSAAKAIAKATHGVILNPQDDTIETPAGVSRFLPPRKQESFSVIRLSWWFLSGVLLERAKRESFFELLERLLPEAMPKRYGLYEPPPHVYAETGREHLQQFMDENVHDLIVWRPHRPVTSVGLSCPKPLGASRQGFRSNLVEIQVEAAVLSQPGWAEHLRRFWHQMSRLLRPIYGEVRTIHGILPGGAIIFDPVRIKRENDEATRSWFWRGIPQGLGQAVVLGDDYRRLWPDFVARSEVEDGLAFASVTDWSSLEDLSTQVGPTPQTMALRPGDGMGRSQEYPELWPFGPVFLDG